MRLVRLMILFAVCVAAALGQATNQISAPSISNCKLSVVGAGWGGLVGAYVALNTSLYQANEICVFEKEDHVGGRAHTLSCGFPTQNKVSLGAHRWSQDVHVSVDSFINNVLGLNSNCYSHTPDCSNSGNSFYDLRNSYTGDLSSSTVRKFPYHLDSSESWGGSVPFVFPEDEALSNYPAYTSQVTALQSPDPSVRYPAIKAVMDGVRNYRVNGLLPSELSLRMAVNRSQEFWDFYLNAIGEASYYINHFSIYDLIRGSAWYAVEDTLGTRYRVITDDQGYEIGYDAKDKALAAKLTSLGVRIFLNRELVSIKQGSGTSLTMGFADGTVLTSEAAILNIPVTNLMQLSHDSVIFTAASAEVKKMRKLISPVPALKAYGYWDQAWWQTFSATQSEYSTTRPVTYYDSRDSAVEDCNSAGVCEGWINMGYPDGDYLKYYSYAQRNPSNPEVVIYANTTDKMDSKFFWDFWYHFRQSFCNATNLSKTQCTIKPPSIIAMGVWPEGWHDIIPSHFVGGYVNSQTLTPVPGLKIIHANEDASADQGWANGSSDRVLKGLYRVFGISRPSWLGNDYWWNNIIVPDLI